MSKPSATRRATIAGGVGVIAAIAALIMPHEGLRTEAYRDIAAPHVWTICYGETQNVQAGDVATAEECYALLLERIPDYLNPIDEMLPDLPDNRRVAYASAAWNLGVGIIKRRSRDANGKGIPGTSIYDLERAGKPRQACDRLLVFNTAGGKYYRGLAKRRAAEHAVCVEGLP